MADFKENSPIPEEPQLKMPPRDPSLDDFEKLENFIIQDKNSDIVESQDILGDNELIGLTNKASNDNAFGPKSSNVADVENNVGQDLLGDFNSNKDHVKSDYSRGYNDAPPPYEQSSADLLGDAFDSVSQTSHLPRYTHQAYETTSSARPSEKLLQFEEPPSAKSSFLEKSPGSISEAAEKLVHPPSDSGYVPSPAEENASGDVEIIKDSLRFEEKPSALKISPFVDSVDTLSEKQQQPHDSAVEEEFLETQKETPAETTTYNAKNSKMSTEVSSSKPSAGSACGCPFSPSALFDPNRLHPLVTSLVYWKDPKKSGIVFGVSLLFLISLRYFSFISVVSYLALAVISITLSFRIYKNVLQAVQKSGEGHPFKEILEVDISIPQEKIHETADTIVGHAVTTIVKLRSMFLVEDLIDSIKLGIVLWCLTYLGAWFNGLTLITLGFIAIFSLPKVYETNKAQIDQYLNLVNSQVSGVITAVKSKIPFGQKDKTQ